MELEVKISWDFPVKFGEPYLVVSFGSEKMEAITWRGDKKKSSDSFNTKYSEADIDINNRIINIWIFRSNDDFKIMENSFWLIGGTIFRNKYVYSYNNMEIIKFETKLRFNQRISKMRPIEEMNIIEIYEDKCKKILANLSRKFGSWRGINIAVNSRIGFDKRKKTLLSCFNNRREILFKQEMYHNLQKYIFKYYKLIDGDKKLDMRKAWVDFVQWVATRVHSYRTDMGNGDYVRTYYPIRKGDCDDLILTTSDFFYALLNHKFSIKRDPTFINLKYEAKRHYLVWAVVSSLGNTPNSYGERMNFSDGIPMHAMLFFIKKDAINHLLSGYSGNSGNSGNSEIRKYKYPVLIGESTAMVTPFLHYKPKLLVENKILVQRLEVGNNGFRSLKYGAELNYYKRVHTITSPDFVKVFGASTFKCIYNREDGIPFKRFLMLEGCIFKPLARIKNHQFKYSKQESKRNYPVPSKEFRHFGSIDTSQKRLKSAEEFISKVRTKWDGSKLSALGYYAVEDLIDEKVQGSIIKETRIGYKFDFEKQDLFPNSKYNKMRTYLTYIWHK